MKLLLTTTLLIAASITHAEPQTLTADVWADNWFEMYVNGDKVAEDSVSITTEKSFNAESFTFTADFPMTIGIIAKDFKENDTGLEYIGSRKQQMGDGGLIAQFKNADGQTVAVTDENMRCLVVHRAPIDTSCADENDPVAGVGTCGFEATEIPADWLDADFDDSAWSQAVVHSAEEVRPKDGYDKIDWDESSQLVWSDNLLQDNTLLCRMTLIAK